MKIRFLRDVRINRKIEVHRSIVVFSNCARVDRGRKGGLRE